MGVALDRQFNGGLEGLDITVLDPVIHRAIGSHADIQFLLHEQFFPVADCDIVGIDFVGARRGDAVAGDLTQVPARVHISIHQFHHLGIQHIIRFTVIAVDNAHVGLAVPELHIEIRVMQVRVIIKHDPAGVAALIGPEVGGRAGHIEVLADEIHRGKTLPFGPGLAVILAFLEPEITGTAFIVFVEGVTVDLAIAAEALTIFAHQIACHSKGLHSAAMIRQRGIAHAVDLCRSQLKIVLHKFGIYIIPGVIMDTVAVVEGIRTGCTDGTVRNITHDRTGGNVRQHVHMTPALFHGAPCREIPGVIAASTLTLLGCHVNFIRCLIVRKDVAGNMNIMCHLGIQRTGCRIRGNIAVKGAAQRNERTLAAGSGVEEQRAAVSPLVRLECAVIQSDIERDIPAVPVDRTALAAGGVVVEGTVVHIQHMRKVTGGPADEEGTAVVRSHIAFVRFTVNMDLTPDHHMSRKRTVTRGGTVKVTAAAAPPVVQRTTAAGGMVVPPDVIRQIDGVTEIGNRTAAGIRIARRRKVQTIHTGITAPVSFKQVGSQFHVLVVRIIATGVPALGTQIEGTAVAARPVVAEHVVFKDHRRTVVTGIRIVFSHHKRERTADSAIRMVVFKDAVGDFEAVEFGVTAAPVHTAGGGGTVVAEHRVINIKVMVNAGVETDHTARTPERFVIDKDAAVDIHRGAGTDHDHTAGAGRRIFKMAVPDRQRVFRILRIVAAAAEVDGTAVNVARTCCPDKGIVIEVEAIDRHRGTGCRFVAVVVEPAGGGTAIDETVAVTAIGHIGSVAGHADPVVLDRAVRIVNIFTMDRHRGTDSGDQCPQQVLALVRVVLKTGGGCAVRLRRTVNRRDPQVGIDHTVGVGDGVVAEHRVPDRHSGPVVRNDTAAGGVVGIGAVVHIVTGHNAVKEGVGDRYLTRRCEGKHTGIAFSGFSGLEAVLHIADFQIVDGRHDRRTLDKGAVRRSIVGRTGPDVGDPHVLDVQHRTVDLRGFISLRHIDHVESADITLAVVGGVVVRICRNAVFLELCLLVVDINVLQGHFVPGEADHTIGMHIGDGSTGVVALARGGIRHGPDRSRARIFQVEISALEEDQPVVTGNRSLLGIGLGGGHTDIVDGDVTADGQVVPQELEQTAIDGTAAVNPHAVHRERTAEEGKVLPHELDQTAAVPVGDPVAIKVGLVGIAVHFDIDKGGIAVESQVSAVNTGCLSRIRPEIDHTAGTAAIILLEGDVLKVHIPVELHFIAHKHIEHAAGTASVNIREGIDTVGCGNSMSLPCRRHIRIHIDIDVFGVGTHKAAVVVIRITAGTADHIVNHNVGHRDVAVNVVVIDPAALVPGSDPFKTGVGQRQVTARFPTADHHDRTAAPAMIKGTSPGRIVGDHPLDQMVGAVIQPERAVRTIVQTAENGVVEGGITGVDPHRTAGERDRTDKCRVVHGQVGAVKVQRTGSVRIILLVPGIEGLVVNILAGGTVPLHIVPGGILHKVFVCSRIVCTSHIVCLGDRGELQRIKCHFAGRTIPQNIAIVLLHVEVHAVGGRSVVLGCSVVRLGNHFLKLPGRAGPFRIKIVDGQVGVVHVFRERIVRQVRGVTGTVESDRPEVRAVI